MIHDLPDQLAVTKAVARYALSIDEPEELDAALTAAWDGLEGAEPGHAGRCTCRSRSTCSRSRPCRSPNGARVTRTSRARRRTPWLAPPR